MKITPSFAASFLPLLFCATISVHAQTPIGGTGCANSPEAPTDILLVVGAVGMFYGSTMLSKLRRK